MNCFFLNDLIKCIICPLCFYRNRYRDAYPKVILKRVVTLTASDSSSAFLVQTIRTNFWGAFLLILPFHQPYTYLLHNNHLHLQDAMDTFLFVCFICFWLPPLSFFFHWPAPVLVSPPQPAAVWERPAPPWRAGAPPPAGSRHSGSPSSGKSVCGLSDKKRRRGFDSGRILDCESSCAASSGAAAAVPPGTEPLYFLLYPWDIRQALSHQKLLQILVPQVLLWSPAAGLLPAERTSMTNTEGVPLRICFPGAWLS